MPLVQFRMSSPPPPGRSSSPLTPSASPTPNASSSTELRAGSPTSNTTTTTTTTTIINRTRKNSAPVPSLVARKESAPRRPPGATRTNNNAQISGMRRDPITKTSSSDAPGLANKPSDSDLTRKSTHRSALTKTDSMGIPLTNVIGAKRYDSEHHSESTSNTLDLKKRMESNTSDASDDESRLARKFSVTDTVHSNADSAKESSASHAGVVPGAKRHEDVTTSAFRGFETIDFEEPSHPVLRLHYRNQTLLSKSMKELSNYLVAFTITIIIALLFILLNYSTETIADRRIELVKSYIEEGLPGKALIIGVLISITCAIIPALLIIYYAPSAIGSGMTDVIAFLNGASSLTGTTTMLLCIKYLGAIGLVSAGLFSGVDGPMAKIGAGIGMLAVQN
ncbi:hypothetical protein HDU76_004986, partial [Blyttiomyces sp. JEL0837]